MQQQFSSLFLTSIGRNGIIMTTDLENWGFG
ncbi:hypothetical protein TH47_14655 [Thalassospira sp. MCCC 1A02803]|nr:hypothetical protein TH47_14655 [Thalassospira sp. MCCC 1A02803]